MATVLSKFRLRYNTNFNGFELILFFFVASCRQLIDFLFSSVLAMEIGSVLPLVEVILDVMEHVV